MAKKKKSTKKVKQSEIVERSPFWAYCLAVLFIVAAIFLIFGGFAAGGPLPKDMFHGAYWLLGWVAYATPMALVYWGIYKFTSEDHRIPLPKQFGMWAVLFFGASWLHTAFASKLPVGTITGGHGGNAGRVIGNSVLGALDKFPASLMFFVFTVFAVFFAFGISPKVILKLGSLFKREPEEEDGLAALKAKAENSGFQLNEGVPVEHHNGMKEQPRLSSLKNTAQKLAASEDHEALTTASDPDWKFPGISLLNQKQDKADAGDVEGNAQAIKETFENFNISVEMEGANIGPRVTQYTLKPPTGVKLTKMTALENNLALDLAAHSIRMEAPIPGKRAVGIEVPNVKPAIVRLSSILLSREWAEQTSPLSFAIGKDIAGKPVVADLDKMPHLLVAGQTGSGKSVMINNILTSLLYRNSPADEN